MTASDPVLNRRLYRISRTAMSPKLEKPTFQKSQAGLPDVITVYKYVLLKDLVESRSGAVTINPFRFQIPLIKPDVRISRISAFGPRSIHDFAQGRLRVVCSNRTSPSVS